MTAAKTRMVSTISRTGPSRTLVTGASPSSAASGPATATIAAVSGRVNSGTSAYLTAVRNQPSNRPRVAGNSASETNSGPSSSSSARMIRTTSSTPTLAASINAALNHSNAETNCGAPAAKGSAGAAAATGAGVIPDAAGTGTAATAEVAAGACWPQAFAA